MKRILFAVLAMMPGAVAAQSIEYTGTPASCVWNCPINAVLPYYTPGATISFTGGVGIPPVGSALPGGIGSGFIISNIDQSDPANAFAAGFIAFLYRSYALNTSPRRSVMTASGEPYAPGGSSAPTVTAASYGTSGLSLGQVNLANVPTSAVPEPASWLMMILGTGLMGLALRRRSADQAGSIRTSNAPSIT